MPLELPHDRTVILIRQDAFERSALTRQAIDARYNLTDEEFRVEEGLVALGPLPNDEMLSQMIEEFEANGLVYFEDFFELSGNWPQWLVLYGRSARRRKN
jgi:hypothetical protein